MRKRQGEVRTGRLVMLASALMFFYGFILGGQQLVMADIAAEYHTDQRGMGLLVSASMRRP